MAPRAPWGPSVGRPIGKGCCGRPSGQGCCGSPSGRGCCCCWAGIRCGSCWKPARISSRKPWPIPASWDLRYVSAACARARFTADVIVESTGGLWKRTSFGGDSASNSLSAAAPIASNSSDLSCFGSSGCSSARRRSGVLTNPVENRGGAYPAAPSASVDHISSSWAEGPFDLRGDGADQPPVDSVPDFLRLTFLPVVSTPAARQLD
ncbi:uncharacterized protein [Drosophila kikkawai]|uniref:Uncharacterized protein isoform X2 n=1 Tax=Drosophila kikkawai TaxID=30033 RepID=A0ABM4GMB0_DROKI